MNSKEAYKIIISELPGLKAVKCHEYDSLFVFTMVPKHLVNLKDVNALMDSLCSVDKKTQKVRDFKPFHIPRDEYRKGVEISDFK